jgi:hypothetical protein
MAPLLNDPRYAQAHAKLTLELDHLRAVVDWCTEAGRWAELADMVMRIWVFVFQAGPAVGAEWFERLLQHEDALEPQVLVDLLGESAWLAVGHAADSPQASNRANRSITLAEDEGLDQCPWAWLERSSQAINSSSDRALADAERGLAAAEARQDETAGVTLMGYVGMAHAAAGDTATATWYLDEALRRAEQSGHPVNIQSAVLTSVGRHLFWDGGPDFDASLDILTRHDTRIDDAMAMYRDVFLGATLIGLHRNGAIEALLHALRLADRRASHDATEMALTLLAIAAIEQGSGAEGATLAGYAAANTSRSNRLHGRGYAWVFTALNRALSTVTDRELHEAVGAAASRRQILATVARIGSFAGQQ